MLFSRTTHHTTGLIIEVGSGSVVTSLVVSDPADTTPTLLWTRREYAVLKPHFTHEDAVKSLQTTIMTALMMVESEGLALLRQSEHHTIDTCLVTLSAPWAYTISKIVELDKAEPFTVTEDIMNHLIVTAQTKTEEVVTESQHKETAAVQIITQAVTGITANGYRTYHPLGQQVSNLQITQVSALGHTSIITTVTDLVRKSFPAVPIESYSTILTLHRIIQGLYPTMTEYCLVDLTYEATEIAIVRDDTLHYATHTPTGLNTLVRTIAEKSKRPEADVRTLLDSAYTSDSLSHLTTAEQTLISSVFTDYTAAMAELFTETGDSLTIPKVLFLHGSYLHERFFDNIIIDAAKTATNSSHTIHTVTHDLLLQLYTGQKKLTILQKHFETSTLLAAQFFHKHRAN